MQHDASSMTQERRGNVTQHDASSMTKKDVGVVISIYLLKQKKEE